MTANEELMLIAIEATAELANETALKFHELAKSHNELIADYTQLRRLLLERGMLGHDDFVKVR